MKKNIKNVYTVTIILVFENYLVPDGFGSQSFYYGMVPYPLADLKTKPHQ